MAAAVFICPPSQDCGFNALLFLPPQMITQSDTAAKATARPHKMMEYFIFISQSLKTLV